MTGVAIESKLHLYLYQHSVYSLYFHIWMRKLGNPQLLPCAWMKLSSRTARQAKWPFRCLDGFFTELWMLTNWLPLPPSHHCHSIKADGPPNIRQAPIYVSRDCLQFFTNHLRFLKSLCFSYARNVNNLMLTCGQNFHFHLSSACWASKLVELNQPWWAQPSLLSLTERNWACWA